MSKNSSNNTQRTILGGLSGIVIIAIVLFLQYGLGIDLLEEDEEAAPTATATITPSPMPTLTPMPTTSGQNTDISLTPIPGGYDGGWFQVYFTDPGSFTGSFRDAPIEDALVAAIDNANSTVYAAIFEIDSQPVVDALIDAKRRGVDVRIVTDDEYGIVDSEDSIEELEDADIPIVPDDSGSRLMHNKFFVIDSTYVWTGSTNVTQNGMYKNNNNSIYIRNSRLAQYYTKEFNEMFELEEFGPSSSDEGEQGLAVTIDGTPIEIFFESEGEAEKRLYELIGASSEVRFMALSFTSSLRWKNDGQEFSVMDLLVERASSGAVTMEGIVDSSSVSDAAPLVCAGLPLHKDGNDSGKLHHKVFVFDESIVVIGSFNFSNNGATRNDENMLVVHSPALAQVYLEEFNKRWNESEVATTTCPN